MPGLTSGSGGTSQSNNSTTNTSTDYSPQYDSYVNNILSQATNLGSQPYTPYTGELTAPLNSTEQQGINGITNAGSSYQPFLNSAGSIFNSANPTGGITAASPYLNAASSTPTGTNAANPYLTAASQTWPSQASNFTNPYLSGAIQAGNTAATSNFTNNVLPQLNSQFIGSGGGLGHSNYQNQGALALTNFNNSLNNQDLTAENTNYNNLVNQFQNQQNTLAGIGSTAGSLANSTAATQGQLGATAGSLANNAFTNQQTQGSNIANLGNLTNTLGLGDSQAQVAAGQVAQNTTQAQDTANYGQFQNQINWPYQLTQFLNQVQSGLQIPTTSNSQTTGTQAQAQTGSGSALGTGLGALTGIGSLFSSGAGGTSAANGLGGFLSGLFTTAAAAKTGGHIDSDGFLRKARGGPIARRHFSAGGLAPTIRGAAQNIQRDVDQAKHKPRPAQPAPSQGLPQFKRGGFFAEGGINDPDGDREGYNHDTAPAELRGFYRSLEPNKYTDYGDLLPVARDQITGARRLAMPSMARDGALNMLDLLSGMKTGVVTPGAAQAFLNVSPIGAASRRMRHMPGNAGALTSGSPAERMMAPVYKSGGYFRGVSHG